MNEKKLYKSSTDKKLALYVPEDEDGENDDIY